MPKVTKKIVNFIRSRGFTLIELMVVIAVIGVLASIAIINIPEAQKRARDAQRQADLRQLQTKLEEANSLNTKYPLSDDSYQIKDHPWGSFWDDLKYTVPKDPLSSQSYTYVSDGLSYQLYAQFESTQNLGSFACPTPCGPDGKDNGGVAGGSSTALISWSTTQGGGGGGGGGGGTTTTTTKKSYPLIQGSETYTVSGGTPPYLSDLTINPLDAMVGVTQTVSSHMTDTAHVTSVTVVVKTDNGLRSFPLNLSSGTDLDGQWGASWVVADTHDLTYVFTIRATDAAGSASSADVTVR
jgi:prepilin-type N-terminal cleavage/methylation domain-containing protein